MTRTCRTCGQPVTDKVERWCPHDRRPWYRTLEVRTHGLELRLRRRIGKRSPGIAEVAHGLVDLVFLNRYGSNRNPAGWYLRLRWRYVVWTATQHGVGSRRRTITVRLPAWAPLQDTLTRVRVGPNRWRTHPKRDQP